MSGTELESLAHRLWAQLSTFEGAWRTPLLASRSTEGADARIVVLRAADDTERELVFFTDCHSRKQAQLAGAPQVCLVMFDAAAGEQLRLYGKAREIRDKARLDTWWSDLEAHQQAHYRIGGGAARDNFTAWAVRIERMHHLRLLREGNIAVNFEWRDGRWHGRRVRP